MIKASATRAISRYLIEPNYKNFVDFLVIHCKKYNMNAETLNDATAMVAAMISSNTNMKDIIKILSKHVARHGLASYETITSALAQAEEQHLKNSQD